MLKKKKYKIKNKKKYCTWSVGLYNVLMRKSFNELNKIK